MRLTLAVRDASDLYTLHRQEHEGEDLHELLGQALGKLRVRERVLWIHLDRDDEPLVSVAAEAPATAIATDEACSSTETLVQQPDPGHHRRPRRPSPKRAVRIVRPVPPAYLRGRKTRPDTSDPRIPEQRTAEQRAAEQRAAEQSAAEQGAAEQRAAERDQRRALRHRD